MLESTKTYQASPSARNGLLLPGLFCGFLSVISIAGPATIAWGSAVLYGIPAVVLLIGAIARGTTMVTVSDSEISTHLFGRKKLIRWDEINRRTNRGNDLVLHTATDSIRLSSQLDGYPEIVDTVRGKRPDLWVVTGSATFHHENVSRLLYGGLALCMTVAGIWTLIVGPRLGWSLVISSILFVITGLVSYVLLTRVQKLVLNGDRIMLKGMLSERWLAASDISGLQFHRVFALVGGFNYGVSILLKNGSVVTMSGMKESSATLYNTLATWLRESAGFQE